MHSPDGPADAVGVTGDVHGTAGVGEYEPIGAGVEDRLDFAIDERLAEVRKFDREGSAEAAALLETIQWSVIDSADLADQVNWFVLDVDGAKMTTVVIGNGVFELGGKGRQIDFADFYEILGKFICSASNGLGAREPGRVFFEEMRVVLTDHCGTGTGGTDDRAFGLLEDGNKFFCGGSSRIEMSGVEHWLAATCLSSRAAPGPAEALKYANHRPGGLGIERIGQTSDKDIYLHAGKSLFTKHKRLTFYSPRNTAPE